MNISQEKKGLGEAADGRTAGPTANAHSPSHTVHMSCTGAGTHRICNVQ